MSATDLWTQYQVDRDMDARDQLLSHHLRLVHHVARQILRTSPADTELDELVSAGTVGLMEAVEHFDPERGLAFSTFAAPRIRGAILDDLRRQDHAPRTMRRRHRELNRTRDTLMATLDREPTFTEVADAMGIEESVYHRWSRDVEHVNTVSLDHPLDPSRPGSSTPEEILAGQDGEDSLEALDRREEMEILRDEILKLKEQERVVLSLYYFEELKLHEIATVLGVTESRISQVRSKAIRNLRIRLAHLREDVVQ